VTRTNPPATPNPSGTAAATIGRIDPAQITASWHPGCPVGPEQLRLLTIPYVGFDGGEHIGELVVNVAVADAVAGVFTRLHDARVPIRRMDRIDAYAGDDDASTRANNTSGFNCRENTGGGAWSEHAYGKAVDINPVQNPYVYRDGHVLDPAAAPYVDRTRREPGMIHPDDVVVRAFASIGWGWGGDFDSVKDYQHFSAGGR
jgi:D-alanyl-D-alanine carboxypeptidase